MNRPVSHSGNHPISHTDSILQKRRILVTCGTGGVGKTTLSAALALRAACLGKNAVVITVDPAKRLATSLGLHTLGDHPTDLTGAFASLLKKTKTPCAKLGRLAAIMPDTKRTFENFITNLSPSPSHAAQVIRNPIFQMFAREFSGTNEYMALERLHALDALNQYDSIILDTPPSRNMLAFLDAPHLLSRFFEEKLIRFLVLPANKLLSGTMRTGLQLLEKLTGSGFMTSLFDFAAGLFEVRIKFAANLKNITALLESDAVGFLLVASPHPDTVAETRHFIHSLKTHHFHFEGIALNRTLGYLRDLPSEKNSPSKCEAVGLDTLHFLQKQEEDAFEKLSEILTEETASSASFPLFKKLPELSRDVHSMEDLFHVAMALDQHWID